MSKAQKTKSGRWTCVAFIGRDKDGKKIRKTFTANTKAEAEFLAADYELRHKGEVNDPSFGAALDKYIEDRVGKRSPTTISEYKRAREKDFTDIETIPMSKITQKVIQDHINRFAEKHSPKTCKNHHGLISGVVRLYRPEMPLKTILPTSEYKRKAMPNNEQFEAIRRAVAGTELELPVLLAALGPMRRGEVCALRKENIHKDHIVVCENMVKDRVNDKWVIKSPKTKAGTRVIYFPSFVMDKLQNVEDRVTTLNPDNVTNYFHRAMKKAGLQGISFHSLRHYGASYLHSCGMPMQYIKDRGGWDDLHTVEQIYLDSIDEVSRKENERVNKIMDNLFGNLSS